MDERTPGGAVLAFDIGGTTTKAEVVGPDLRPWASTRAPTPRGAALVDAIAEVGTTLLATLEPDRRAAVSAAGLALPGIVDTVAGTSVFAANLDLRDEPIVEPVSRRLGLPVRLGHDVTVAAEAERQRGAARDLVDPVVVFVGTGIGAVSYVHGRRVVGTSGQAGELGHVVVRPAGPLCGCGVRGCLEAVASAAAVARAYTELSGRPVRGAEDVVALRGKDPAADAVWDEAAEALGDGLLAATALLAPGGIVLGGGLAMAGRALLDPVEDRLRTRANTVPVPPLLTAALGSRAGVVGAALIALDHEVPARIPRDTPGRQPAP
ncbi:ROK family protein [Saccharomonospora saliphila]|uniref:ROK family protein n=1 Tax=Saccharomonospora saliphila TaxID=369829 RepID=UPI0003670310|nr:ROK family protein [Saccharomonospora saliphila]